jgi:hypothetical protein
VYIANFMTKYSINHNPNYYLNASINNILQVRLNQKFNL